MLEEEKSQVAYFKGVRETSLSSAKDFKLLIYSGLDVRFPLKPSCASNKALVDQEGIMKLKIRSSFVPFPLCTFSMNRPTGPIQSLSRNVRQSCVCGCLCHRGNTASGWTGDF